VPSRPTTFAILYGLFAVLMFALHLAYLRLPFHWDEMGQFVPAALDLYREGAWVPVSTLPNVHPPGLMALLAGVWHMFGYSIAVSRAAMLAVASFGALFTFLLAIQLGRGTAGAPAFAAVLFLIASPLFYTQSMMVQLDMPAMTLATLALLLFLDGRYVWCAAVSTLLVLVKETALSTPLVFAAWLWLREKRPRAAACFLVPFAALAAWLALLRYSTGEWLGNAEFAEYNVVSALAPAHLIAGILRRVWTLLISDGHWIGSLALFAGGAVFFEEVQREKDKPAVHRIRPRWEIALWVALAQIAVVTLFGGALLERYLLPVLPVLYAAFAAALSAYPPHWRWASQAALAALLVAGWFWNPPYPFPFENNLAMINFVRLQQDAAGFLEATAPGQRIASVWPFTDAISHPEMGYVEHAMKAVEAQSLGMASLASLDRRDYDLVVIYTRTWPLQGMLDASAVRDWLRRYFNYQLEASPEQLRNGLDLTPVATYARQGQRITIYAKPGELSARRASRGPRAAAPSE
jgi:hypothetical protein